MTEQLLTSAAPVFTVGGQVAGELARDVVRLEVEEGTDGLKTLSLRLLAFGPSAARAEESLLYLDGRLFDFGRDLSVSVGPSGQDATIFSGRITAIEASFGEEREPQVVIYAEDRLMDLRMTRRIERYEQVSDEDLARTIAGRHGVGAAVGAPGPTYEVVQQWNVSDLAFLRERAARVDAEIWIQDGTLHFESRANRSAPSLTLVQGNQLLSAEIRADLAHQRSAVTVSGYDAAGRESISEEAGSDALAAEAGSGRTGIAVLDQALGRRVSYRVMDAPLVATEARGWAKAELLRRGRSFVTVDGVTRGSPTLVVGATLRLEEVGAPFTGDGYRATRVQHTYDLVSGYRTWFRAERATINPPGAG